VPEFGSLTESVGGVTVSHVALKGVLCTSSCDGTWCEDSASSFTATKFSVGELDGDIAEFTREILPSLMIESSSSLLIFLPLVPNTLSTENAMMPPSAAVGSPASYSDSRIPPSGTFKLQPETEERRFKIE